MYGKLKKAELRKRERFANVKIILISAICTFFLLVAADNRDISRKWVTAIIGTAGPFILVLYAFRRRLSRWSLWVAVFLCLAAHSLIFFFFFQYVLASVQWFSIWLMLPVMIVETFVLLILVKRIEEGFTGRRETMRLDV